MWCTTSEPFRRWPWKAYWMNYSIHWPISRYSMIRLRSRRCKIELGCFLSHCCTASTCRAMTFYWPAWRQITSYWSWRSCKAFLPSAAPVNRKIKIETVTRITVITALVIIITTTTAMSIKVRVRLTWTMTWWVIPHQIRMQWITTIIITIITKTARNMLPTFTR